MGEMTPLERILAQTYKKRADKLPFFHSWENSQIGWAERKCRNMGMGMFWPRPCYATKMHGVKSFEAQAETSGQTVIRRTFKTPVGSVYLEEKREPGVSQWHGLRSWRNVMPWQTARLIKEPQDYKVVKYMVENTEYVPYYFPIEQAVEWLGDDGIVVNQLPPSAMHTLMTNYIGSEGGAFYIHHAKYPDLVEDLYGAVSKSREPLYEMAAKAPVPIVTCGESLDGVIVNPKLFEKYYMPEYEKQAKVLHEHGKLMQIHLDGRVDGLKDLIGKTSIDIIEALHPLPMGDLPIGEALSAWKDKIVWASFPASITVLGPEEVKKHALKLLRDVGSGERLAIVFREHIIPNNELIMLARVFQNADLPLTPEKIDRIERSLAEI